MSVEFWSAACNASASRPLSQKLQENAGGYYFAIATYTAAAVYSGYWMLKYYVLRLSEGRRIDDLVWSKLGIYLFVVFLASLSGAVTRAGWMLAAEYRFSRDYAITDQEFYLLDREELQVYVHYRIMRGIETPFLSIAFLMVLNRLTKHAYTVSASGKVGLSQSARGKLRMMFKGIMILVSICSAIGISSSFASAKYLNDISGSLLNAALKCDVNGSATQLSRSFFAQANLVRVKSGQAFFAQSLSDVVGIVLITIMFSVIGPVSVYTLRQARVLLEDARGRVAGLAEGDKLHRPTANRTTGTYDAEQSAPIYNSNTTSSVFNSGKSMAAEMVDNAIDTALGQRDRYIWSYATTFIAFIVRSLFIVSVAIQAFESGSSSKCSVCGSCQSLGLLIGTWYVYNTWFSGILFAITTPVAFCVSGINDPPSPSPLKKPASRAPHPCLPVLCMMSTKERELLRIGKMPASGEHRVVSQGTELLVNRFGLALRPGTYLDAAETSL
jgi:hypothetical protein